MEQKSNNSAFIIKFAVLAFLVGITSSSYFFISEVKKGNGPNDTSVSENVSTDSTTQDYVPPSYPQLVKEYETFYVSDVLIKFTNAEITYDVNGLSADSGKKFVLINLEVTNLREQSVNFQPESSLAIDIHLVNSQGVEFDFDQGISANREVLPDDVLLGEDIESSGVASGKLVYVVDDSAESLTLKFIGQVDFVNRLEIKLTL